MVYAKYADNALYKARRAFGEYPPAALATGAGGSPSPNFLPAQWAGKKLGKEEGERLDPPVVATLQPGAIDIERLRRSWYRAESLRLWL